MIGWWISLHILDASIAPSEWALNLKAYITETRMLSLPSLERKYISNEDLDTIALPNI